VFVHETQLMSKTGAADWRSPWSEQWMLRYCGQLVQAEFKFTPTPATGGYSFSALSPRIVGQAPA
jgi:hypothetical protein